VRRQPAGIFRAVKSRSQTKCRAQTAEVAKEPPAGLSPSLASRTSRDLLDWFRAEARDLPWRRTREPYAVWVSEVMLQQTQVKTVVPYWERWMRELPDVRALARAKPEQVLKLWEGLGYYSRARNLHRAAQVVVERHEGKFPRQFTEVLALPGVGRYTAGAICSIAFNQPTPLLDGNVIRVLTRLFGIASNPKEKATNQRLWALAELLVQAAAQLPERSAPFASAGNCSSLNQSLMELGAALCTPRQPQCDACPLRASCVARKAGNQESLPNPGKRMETTAHLIAAFVVQEVGRFLVRQRPEGVVNAHLWEFPNVELKPDATLASVAQDLRLWLESPQPFCVVKHSITRHRITLEAFRAKRMKGTLSKDCRWLPLEELQKLAFPAAHRRILKTVLAARSSTAVS